MDERKPRRDLNRGETAYCVAVIITVFALPALPLVTNSPETNGLYLIAALLALFPVGLTLGCVNQRFPLAVLMCLLFAGFLCCAIGPQVLRSFF